MSDYTPTRCAELISALSLKNLPRQQYLDEVKFIVMQGMAWSQVNEKEFIVESLQLIDDTVKVTAHKVFDQPLDRNYVPD